MVSEQKEQRSVYSTYRGGPLGCGDPNNRTISDSERSTIMSKFVQEKLLTELCYKEWRDWRKCLRQNKEKWFPNLTCKDYFKTVNTCENNYLYDAEKLKQLEDEYLSMRSEYRKTGVGFSFMNKDKLRKFFDEHS